MTPPLVPPEVDLRDFPYIPLDVIRLRDSDLFVLSTGDEFKAAVALWCAAWHQVPAGSLPDNDLLLASLSGFGKDIKAWNVVKANALHRWVKCSDGRLYHPTVSEKALDAWDLKQKRRSRTEAARGAKVAKASDNRPDPAAAPPEVGSVASAVAIPAATQGSISVTEIVTSGNRREGNGIEGKKDKEETFVGLEPSSVSAAPRTDMLGNPVVNGSGKYPTPVKRRKNARVEYSKDFEDFWLAYPRDANMSKIEAYGEWGKLDDVDHRAAFASLKAFRAYCQKNREYRPIHAERYLKFRRFDGHSETAVRVAEAGDVFVKTETLEWEAWDEHLKKTTGKSPPVNREGGWFFKTKWPPKDDARP